MIEMIPSADCICLPLVLFLLNEVSAVSISNDTLCTVTCETCEINGTCSSCSPGKYGEYCDHDCSPHCEDGRCSKQSGDCVCTKGYYRSGESCIPCIITCTECIDSGTCGQCEPGYYGPICQQNCSHCVLGTCSKHKCVLGCKSGFYSTELFGVVSCEPCDWTCTTCSTFVNCTSCVDGLWGSSCETECLGNCTMCDQSTGKCFSKTCQVNQYMNKTGDCNDCPFNCRTCNNTMCTKCYGDYTGNRCKTLNCSHILYCEECSYNSTMFDTLNLFCIRCDNEHFGDTCQYSCSPGCKYIINSTEPTCAPRTGNCLKGCKRGYFGKGCNETCAVGCRGTCDSETGQCTCKNGYVGDQCDVPCNTTGSETEGGHDTCFNNAHLNQSTYEKTSGYSLPVSAMVGIIAGTILAIIASLIVYVLKRRRDSNQCCTETMDGTPHEMVTLHTFCTLSTISGSDTSSNSPTMGQHDTILREIDVTP